MAASFYNIFPALLSPVLALVSMGLGFGALLAYVAKKFKTDTDPVVEKINDLLPQTQCGQCGYPGCKPYAEAIAAGDVINKCPPGGDKAIARLADLLNLNVLPLDREYGQPDVKNVAFIREAECIGCAKCIPACPVDAILGAPKFMHTVIESECTGCDLCIEPCPVDCIELVPVAEKVTLLKSITELNCEETIACINCGLCIEQCPVEILPHELYKACKNSDFDQAASLNLMHCIECAKCDSVCPSRIPLMAYYQTSKFELNSQRNEQKDAEQAKHRHDLHQKRISRLKEVEDIRRQQRKKLTEKSTVSNTNENIQAALERVKSKNQSN